jgi:putative membrane protein
MKLRKQLLGGLICAGLAASLSFAQQSSPTPPDQSATPQTKTTQDPADQINKPARKTTNDTTDSNRSRTSDAKTAEHSGHTAGAAGSSADGSMVGKTDHAFMTKAAMGGMMEVQVAQMAQQKASGQEVKDYARKLEQDHSKANDKLKAIAKERQVELPSDVGPEHKAMIAKLTNLSGAEFDTAFMKMQVQHHRKDVKEFERASTRSMDSDLKEFASSTLPTLKEHLSQAEQINNSTRSRKQ